MIIIQLIGSLAGGMLTHNSNFWISLIGWMLVVSVNYYAGRLDGRK